MDFKFVSHGLCQGNRPSFFTTWIKKKFGFWQAMARSLVFVFKIISPLSRERVRSLSSVSGRVLPILTTHVVRAISPADRGTKKHVYLPYRGAIPFWFHLVPLRLVSIFLNAGRVEISCRLLPTRIKLYCYQKRWCLKFNFRKNNLHHQKAGKN